MAAANPNGKRAISRLLFWLIVAPLFGISGILALFSLINFLQAPHEAADNAAQRSALLRRAELVERFRTQNGRLPSREEFNAASTGLNDGVTYPCEISTSRPEAGEGFKFPKWPEGTNNYAISYWRGEWSEFYDSNSRSTTLDVSSKTWSWIQDGLWPLAGTIQLRWDFSHNQSLKVADNFPLKLGGFQLNCNWAGR